MFDLPRTTHRYLIEPISEKPHIQFTIMKRFLKFCEQLRTSKKSVLRSMISQCEKDTTTRTGHNLRTIMLLTNSCSLIQMNQTDITSQTYKNIPDGEGWRVHLVKELIEARHDRNLLHEFSYDEIDDLVHLACTN